MGVVDAAVRRVVPVVDGAVAVVTDAAVSRLVVVGCVDVIGRKIVVVFSVAVVCTACVVISRVVVSGLSAVV